MNYVSDVADTFLARCPNVSMLGPSDFTTIAEWEKEEVPLAVIFESIHEVFDDAGGPPSNIESISDLQATVKRNFVFWLKRNAWTN